jgi:ArsR family transcriptional regulator
MRLKVPGHEFQELQKIEEKARMGEEVSDELENLIKDYEKAMGLAKNLLKQLNERKRALKKRSMNLPVITDINYD